MNNKITIEQYFKNIRQCCQNLDTSLKDINILMAMTCKNMNDDLAQFRKVEEENPEWYNLGYDEIPTSPFTCLAFHDLSDAIEDTIATAVKYYVQGNKLAPQTIEEGKMGIDGIPNDEIHTLFQSLIESSLKEAVESQQKTQSSINSACSYYMQLHPFLEFNPNYVQYSIAINLGVKIYNLIRNMFSIIYVKLNNIQQIVNIISTNVESVFDKQIIDSINTRHNTKSELSSDAKKAIHASTGEIENPSAVIEHRLLELYKTITPDFKKG